MALMSSEPTKFGIPICNALPKAEDIVAAVRLPVFGEKLSSNTNTPKLYIVLSTVTLETPPTLPTPARRRKPFGLTMTAPVPSGVPVVAVTCRKPPPMTLVPPV